MPERFDAAIVGGGPAGALAARLLAQRGWRVLLVERGARNRNKTCGHCLAGRALPILDEAGLLECVRAIATGRTASLRVHDERGSCLSAPIAADAHGENLIVPRSQFDQLLRDAAAEAGATVWHDAAARVLRVHHEQSQLRVGHASQRIDVECRLLIGADGVGSAVARAGGLADASNAGRKFGFAFDVAANADAIESGAIEMFLAPGGYLGVVRQNDDTLHVAALLAASDGRGTNVPAAFVAKVAALHPAIQHALGDLARSAALRDPNHQFIAVGPMPWRPRAVSSRALALVGDAAGYIEPFTGEGIAWALHSATLLAKAIEAGDGAWNRSAADIYADMWRNEIQRRQRVCGWLAATLERPRLSRWMLRAGRAVPMVTRRLVREVTRA